MKKKRILLDILLNLMGLYLLVFPTIMSYSRMEWVLNKVAFSPIFITWIVPFYLLSVNAILAKKNNSRYPLWRIGHCILISFVGYALSCRIIENYYLEKGSSGMGYMTDVVLYYEFIYDVVIITGGLFAYQIKLLIKRYRATKGTVPCVDAETVNK